ncbi:MAG: ABC transporter permease subunit [Polyangiaceae bacterium]
MTSATGRAASWRRLRDLAPLGLLVAVATLVDRTRSRAPDRLVPEDAFLAPTWSRPLGAGEAGVDLAALVARAELQSLALALVVALVGIGLGLPLGAFAAMARGRVERGVARACDLVQAFPTFLLALAVLSSVRSPTRIHLALVFAATAWAPFARLALAETRVLRSTAFVEAAYALGRDARGVFLRHVLPNLLPVAAVQLGASAAAIVVSEAALAFVGLGPRDGVSLGGLLDQGVLAMLRAPHVLVLASATVFVTSSALLLAGRAADGRRR